MKSVSETITGLNELLDTYEPSKQEDEINEYD
jgi:hypothetical protein